MIFAETARLQLRALERTDLPRLAKMLDVWEVARWLAVVPFPYTMRDAEDFYTEIAASYDTAAPQAFVLALKGASDILGMVGLHPPRGQNCAEGEIEIGYWLGLDYWRQGLMGEAVARVIKIGFDRPETKMIGATTALNNTASQKVLARAGLSKIAVVPRDYTALRGDDQVFKWLLTRADYEKRAAS